jgi:hypothetical protein
MHALMWKAVPALILAGLAGLLLRELLQWFERSLTRWVRARRDTQQAKSTKHSPLGFDLTDVPHCPSCNRKMVKRKARRGERAGEEFWGCSTYPTCRGTRPV